MSKLFKTLKSKSEDTFNGDDILSMFPNPQQNKKRKFYFSAPRKKSINETLKASGTNMSETDDYNNMKSFMERMRSTKRYDKKQLAELFAKDEKILKDESIEPRPQRLSEEIEVLIGKERNWSHGSEENDKFRREMDSLHRGLSSKKIPKKSFDLARYFTIEKRVYLSKKQQKFRIRTFFSENFLHSIGIKEKVKKNVLEYIANGSQSGEEIAGLFLENLSIFLKKKIEKKQINDRVKMIAFKITGKCEYIFGDEKLMKYDIIRKILNNPNPVIMLTLCNKYTEIKSKFTEKERKYYRILETIDYDISKTKKKKIIHDEISFAKFKDCPEKIKTISAWDLTSEFNVNIRQYSTFNIPENFERFKLDQSESVSFCVAEIVIGDICLGKKFTKAVPFSTNIVWNQTLIFSTRVEKFLVCELPKKAVLCLTVYSRAYKSSDPLLKCTSGYGELQKGDIPLGSVSLGLFNYKGELRMGTQAFNLHQNQSAKLWRLSENKEINQSLTVQFDQYPLPVVYPDEGKLPKKFLEKLKYYNVRNSYTYSKFSGKKNVLKKEIKEMKKIDPLMDLTDKQRWILWDAREDIINEPKLLPLFLLSVPYQIPAAVVECHRILKLFKPPNPLDCFELLDFKYQDDIVRKYAVERINCLNDNELLLYLLQLTNTLKFELFHDSPLARFLLQRALRNPLYVGHMFFWYLRSEVDDPTISERCGLLLEEFLRRCGSFRIELLKMYIVHEQLLQSALAIKNIKGKGREKNDKRVALLKEKLRSFFYPSKFFKLPLFPKIELTKIIIEKAKVMSSKKLPLMISFKNNDEFDDGLICIMFKVGDDLRQDLICLQSLKIMDCIWKENYKNLRLSPYKCICTGYMTGMIEIVKNSQTVANIVHKHGVLKKDAILNWIIENNRGEDPDYVQNFLLSCAGYCVGTYVIGIGDRHNDNVMCKTNGDLFHIDFGHFLGHIKKFLGVKRETSPFVFTNQYCQVLGGVKHFKFSEFQATSCMAFSLLRKNANFIITLFLLMIGCGLPELKDMNDVKYIKKSLVLDLPDKEADQYFKSLIDRAMGNVRQGLNDTWHVIYHKVIQGTK